MSKTNEGGHAFPVQLVEHVSAHNHPGMTLRDYFAAKETLREWDNPDALISTTLAEALAGEKQPKGGWSKDPVGMLKWEAKWRAAMRYIRADAMLAERERGQQ